MWIKRCKLLTSAPTLLQLTMEAGAGKGVFLCGGVVLMYSFCWTISAMSW